MTQFLPPNLLALFAPRDPIPYLPPVDKLPYEKKTAGYLGVSDFLNFFEDPKDTPPPTRIETREERQERKRKEKAEQVAYKLEQDIALWRPSENSAATSDPYKTLFVARVNYDTSDAKLRREFEKYGKIRKTSIIYDQKSAKPRGYAFIEYEHARDMHSAYKHADGQKIDGRRVLVDVERGRTVKGWLPRRLGGGLGGTRRGGPDVNLKHSGREEQRGEERYLNRDRGERPERPERRRSRSRSRERRRRSRSRSGERHRRDRHKRDRSPHDRERVRDVDTGSGIEKSADGIVDVTPEVVPESEPRSEKRRRSRSRDRDRKRSSRRSRSRDRKRRDYDRGDREGRRERDRPRDQDDRQIKEEPPRIKEEPIEPEEMKPENFDNGDYNDGDGVGDYNNYNNNSMESSQYEGY